MARTAGRLTGGVLFLDSEGVAKLVRRDRAVQEIADIARQDGFAIAASVLTFIEANYRGIDQRRLAYVRSGIKHYPVTEGVGRSAEALLIEHGLHGHKYAIDAVVAATLLSLPGPRVMLTSDTDDMTRFLGKRAKVVEV